MGGSFLWVIPMQKRRATAPFLITRAKIKNTLFFFSIHNFIYIIHTSAPFPHLLPPPSLSLSGHSYREREREGRETVGVASLEPAGTLRVVYVYNSCVN